MRLSPKTGGLELSIRLATLEIELKLLTRALERRYSPDQPRVAAGNPDGGQWTSGGGASSRALLSGARVAAKTNDFNYACRVLRLNPDKASDVLHAIKNREGLGGANNCTFDTETGDVFFNGEPIGNLKERP